MTEPEAKRKAIGREFIRSFEEAQRKLIAEAGEEGADIKFLVQGTLYPDVVESGAATAPQTLRATTTWAAFPTT